MALRKNNNITMCLVGKADVLTSALPAVGAYVTPANLPQGGLVLVDMANKRISSVATGADFRIVQGNGSDKPLLMTPILNQARNTKTVGAHRSAKQQITTIGYNGTIGSLPAANNTSYFIKVRKNDNDTANQSQPMSLFAQFKTDASGTQEELAIGLLKNGIKNFAQEAGNGYLQMQTICNDAGAAITVAVGADLTHLQFVNGSKTVTGLLAGVPELGADEVFNNIVAGDYLRAGTATTAPVYKVTAVTAGTATTPATMTLDVAFQGISTNIAYGSTEVITAAAATAASWGIVITGKENKFDVNKFRNYYSNRFTATFSDPTIKVTPTQGASDGVGVWQKVAMDEYMTYGFEGQNEMIGVPPTPRYQFVQSAATTGATNTNKYSAYQIAWTEETSDLVSNASAKGSVILYLNLDQTALGVIPAAAAEAELVTALGGTVADFNQVS